MGTLLQRTVKLVFTGLWVLLLTGLSSVAGYRIRQPDALMDFDIATMLTPMGLVRHFVLRQTNELTPYYFMAVEGRTPLFQSVFSSVLTCSFLALSLAGLFLLRARAR
jgi:hypothetical protein